MARHQLIEHLTPEQAARLPLFRREWFEVGTSTARADRAKAEAAILAMRAEIGAKVPRPTFIWCDSPATALMAIHVIKSSQWEGFVKGVLKKLRRTIRNFAKKHQIHGKSLRTSLETSLRTSLNPVCAWCGDEIWDEIATIARCAARDVPIHPCCESPWKKRGRPDITDGAHPGRSAS